MKNEIFFQNFVWPKIILFWRNYIINNLPTVSECTTTTVLHLLLLVAACLCLGKHFLSELPACCPLQWVPLHYRNFKRLPFKSFQNRNFYVTKVFLIKFSSKILLQYKYIWKGWTETYLGISMSPVISVTQWNWNVEMFEKLGAVRSYRFKLSHIYLLHLQQKISRFCKKLHFRMGHLNRFIVIFW